MDCYQLQLGHELLVDQLNRHLLKPNTGCESQDHLGLGNFSQVFEILRIVTLNSPFPHPWAVETLTSSGLCSRAPCLPPQSTFGTDFCSSQTGETFKHKSFSRQMLLANFSFYQNRFCQTLSKELLFSAKFPFRKSCQKHQTLLFQSLKLLQLLPISLSLQKAF